MEEKIVENSKSVERQRHKATGPKGFYGCQLPIVKLYINNNTKTIIVASETYNEVYVFLCANFHIKQRGRRWI